MKTMKKFFAIIICLCLNIGVFAFPAFAGESQSEVSFIYDGPTTFKIGDDLDVMGEILFENLDPEQKFVWIRRKGGGSGNISDYILSCGYGYGAEDYEIDENGTLQLWLSGVFGGLRNHFYKPGTVSCQFGYFYSDSYESFSDDFKSIKDIGSPIVVTIEEPVIQTNLPEAVKVNDSVNLITELTNVNLENREVAHYLDENNYFRDVKNYNYLLCHDMLFGGENWGQCRSEPVYQPSVEILEGGDIVSQSNQDYSNTLKSSETLTFTGIGVVKLKVKYTQFITSTSQMRWQYSYDDECNGYVDAITGSEFLGYDTYSPEKVITIYVTEDGKVPNSETYSKEDLQNLVSQNQGIDASYYTAESFQAYTTALEKATAVLNNWNASSEEIAEVYIVLESAIKGLIKSTDNNTDNSTGSSTGNSTTSLASESSPKTGDVNINFLLLVSLMSVLGLILALRKKASELSEMIFCLFSYSNN